MAPGSRSSAILPPRSSHAAVTARSGAEPPSAPSASEPSPTPSTTGASTAAPSNNLPLPPAPRSTPDVAASVLRARLPQHVAHGILLGRNVLHRSLHGRGRHAPHKAAAPAHELEVVRRHPV